MISHMRIATAGTGNDPQTKQATGQTASMVTTGKASTGRRHLAGVLFHRGAAGDPHVDSFVHLPSMPQLRDPAAQGLQPHANTPRH